MKLTNCFQSLVLAALAAFTLAAQQPDSPKQELAFTVGQLSGSQPNATAGILSLGSGVAVEANYARKFHDWEWGSLYWEVNGLYGPRRYLSGTPTSAVHDIWNLYVTPGLKLQFLPRETISPYVVGGGGYALYGESKDTIAGGTAAVSGHTNRGAVDVGGGVDFALGKRYLLRADARGIYTGGPNFGVNTPGGQFNFVISGGFVFRFPK
jgi:opacity protein-like surface antigen